MAKMKVNEFVDKLKDIATNYKTLYIMGCFGAPLNDKNKKRYCNNDPYNRQSNRQEMIMAASEDTFGFDCVCLIKGVLWGWNGNKDKTYGGAKYACNGVPDIGANTMITKCADISTDFSHVEIGEAVWSPGHIGIYIGDGLAIECTPRWKNCVQITACNCNKPGYDRRDWVKHGKLPYIEYEEQAIEIAPPVASKPIISDKKTEYDVGDVVDFKGNTHYTSSYASAVGKPCKPGKVKITAKRMNGAHPYQGKAIPGGGSNANGWLNAEDLGDADTPYEPKGGDKVRVQKDAPIYGTSRTFSSWVYNATLYVRDVKDSRVVVSTLKSGPVTGAVDKKYLTKAV